MSPQAGSARDAWAAEAAQHGGTGTQRLLEVAELAAPPEVAEALELAPGDRVVVRRRLMLFNGRPVELTDSYYPAGIAEGTPLAEPQKIRGGAVALLAELGYRPRFVREDVSTRRPTEQERTDLQLGEDDWVLGLTRLLSAEDRRPVELSVMTMVAEGRRLRYEMSME